MKIWLLICVIFYGVGCSKPCDNRLLESVVELVNADTIVSNGYKASEVLMKKKLFSKFCSFINDKEKLIIFEQEGNNGYFHRGLVFFSDSQELFSYMVDERFKLKFAKGGRYDKDGHLQKLLKVIMASNYNLQQFNEVKKQSHAPTTKLYMIDLENTTNNKLVSF